MRLEEIAKKSFRDTEATKAFCELVTEWLDDQPEGFKCSSVALLRGLGATMEMSKGLLSHLGSGREWGAFEYHCTIVGKGPFGKNKYEWHPGRKLTDAEKRAMIDKHMARE